MKVNLAVVGPCHQSNLSEAGYGKFGQIWSHAVSVPFGKPQSLPRAMPSRQKRVTVERSIVRELEGF